MDKLTNLLSRVDLASLLLLVFMVTAAVLLWNCRKDKALSQFFRDTSGKLSLARVATLVCLAISSWVVVFSLTNSKLDNGTFQNLILIYCACWSGSSILSKLIDAWHLTKTGMPPSPTKEDSE